MSGWVAALIAAVAVVWQRAARRGKTGLHYPAGSDRLTQLLREAAPAAQVPIAWADDPDIHYIIGAESAGWVGRPNYTYGERNDEAFPADIHHPTNARRWPEVHRELQAEVKGARSTATGLGQLIFDNVQTHYPEQLDGIGDPWNEAVGFLSYVRTRYGTPSEAARFRRDRGNY